jgi:hypothetical protein
MGRIQIDPRALYVILAVVVAVVALLVYKGADAPQKVNLPDPNMFKVGHAKT